MKPHFLGSVLVLVLGVNLAGWALSVGFSPMGNSATTISVPVTPSGIAAQAQTASVAAPYAPPTFATTATTTPDTIIPTPNYHNH